MTEEKVLELADQTARQYQMFLGLDTLPRLLLQNLSNQKQFGSGEPRKTFHLPDEYPCTGRILINLHQRCVRVETIQSKTEAIRC